MQLHSKTTLCLPCPEEPGLLPSIPGTWVTVLSFFPQTIATCSTAPYQAGKILNVQVCLSWGLAKQNSFSKACRGVLTSCTSLRPSSDLLPTVLSPASLSLSLLVYVVRPFGKSHFALKILLVLLKPGADPHLRLQCLKKN